MNNQLLVSVMNQTDLSAEETRQIISAIMEGTISEPLMAAFLTALEIKGITTQELTAAAVVMREKSEKMSLAEEIIVDTCGTGGDAADTFNVSTASAFVVATAGAKVVKHGNRAISSRCGSADVLEALGADINLSPVQTKEVIAETGIGFLFAPAYHKAMKHVANVRKQLGIKTIFNRLGPLTNPAGANYQVIGVYDPDLTETFCQVLRELGSKHVLCVSGLEGLDELSVTGKTKVSELKDGVIQSYVITPEDYHLTRSELADLSGGTAADNAKIIRELFSGQKGARRDLLVLNAAAALYVAQKADSLEQGVLMAAQLLDSGKVLEKLDQFIEATNCIAGKGGQVHVS